VRSVRCLSVGGRYCTVNSARTGSKSVRGSVSTQQYGTGRERYRPSSTCRTAQYFRRSAGARSRGLLPPPKLREPHTNSCQFTSQAVTHCGGLLALARRAWTAAGKQTYEPTHIHPHRRRSLVESVLASPSIRVV
jgi:hypothetical protein